MNYQTLMHKYQTCLVTGGAGFIGCAISDKLTKHYNRVFAFDNLHPQIHLSKERPKRLASNVTLINGDVCNNDDWDMYLPEIRPDIVIHLAAETGTGQSLTEASRHSIVNVVGTTRMVDAFVRHNIIPKIILLTSSRAVYGEGLWKDIKSGFDFYPGQRSRQQLEKGLWDFVDSKYITALNSTVMKPAPTSIYGATKLAQENILSSWSTSFGVDLITLRLQNVYGPGQSLINSYTGIVSLFARIAKDRKSIPLYEDGAMLRDFIMIEDVASAIIYSLLSEKSVGKILDIGSGVAVTIKELARIISNRYNAPEPHICGKYRHGDVRHASCDISFSKEVLCWEPVWSLEKGLHRLCDWIDDVCCN